MLNRVGARSVVAPVDGLPTSERAKADAAHNARHALDAAGAAPHEGGSKPPRTLVDPASVDCLLEEFATHLGVATGACMEFTTPAQSLLPTSGPSGLGPEYKLEPTPDAAYSAAAAGFAAVRRLLDDTRRLHRRAGAGFAPRGILRLVLLELRAGPCGKQSVCRVLSTNAP